MCADVILEKEAKLSESILWQLQNAAYTQYGVDAWRYKGVPFYLTSNPYTARQYAQVVVGYLRDCTKADSATPLDQSQPVHIFDLGAGTGRFGFLFLKQLINMLSELSMQQIKIRYIMTDIVDTNIQFLKAHPYLQVFIQEGMLDFAKYHHSNDKPLELILSKQTISKETVANPIIVIGNYFFDTIPQDLFKANKEILQEGAITISVPESAELGPLEPTNPALIKQMKCTYNYRPARDANYYKDERLNRILQQYCHNFDNIPFLFPVGAFQSIQYFANLSDKRMLLIAGDQGVCTPEQIQEWGEPHIARHGSFSISVSYHALSQFFNNEGGMGLLTTLSDPLFVILAAVFGGKEHEFRETKSAFHYSVDAFEPSDYWKIVACTEEEWRTPSLEYILMLLKLGNWDPMNFHAFYDVIRRQIHESSLGVQRRLVETIDHVWGNFYPISKEEGDFVMNLGVLLFEMKRHEKAVVYFERSLALTGDKMVTWRNMGASYLAMENVIKAVECFEKAKQLE